MMTMIAFLALAGCHYTARMPDIKNICIFSGGILLVNTYCVKRIGTSVDNAEKERECLL